MRAKMMWKPVQGTTALELVASIGSPRKDSTPLLWRLWRVLWPVLYMVGGLCALGWVFKAVNQ